MADLFAAANDMRAAAQALRERAAQATPSPWTLYDRGVCWEIDQLDEHDGTSFLKGDAHWIAMVQPAIAEPLAAWLDEEAERADVLIGRGDDPGRWESGGNRHALDLAQLILGAPVG